MKKILLALSLIGLSVEMAPAQIVQHTYLQPNNSTVAGVATDALDNFILAGTFIESGWPLNPVRSIVRKFDTAGNMLWVGQVATGVGHGNTTCTDANGNVFVVGSITSSFGGFQLTGGSVLPQYGGNDIFLAKYSPSGTLIWAKSYGSPNNDFPYSIACDVAGNVVFSGRAGQNSLGPNCCTMQFGSGVTTSSSNFVAKISAAGVLSWAIPVGAPAENGTYIRGININQTGEVTFGGRCWGPLTIGASNFGGQTYAAFTAKLDSMGLPLWAKQSSGEPFNIISSSGPSGPKVIGGAYIWGLNFDSVSLPSANGNTNGFLAKYSDTGALQWAKPIVSAQGSAFDVRAVLTDAQENAFLAGSIAGSVTIDNQTFSSSGTGNQLNMFLGKFDAAGNLIWGIQGGRTTVAEPSFITDLYLNSQQECFAAGATGYNLGPSPMTLGNYTSTENGCFLYKLNTTLANKIAGRIFYDFNANQVKDANEPIAPGRITHTNPGSFYSGSNNVGQYVAYTDSGSFTTTLPNSPLYYNLVPSSHTVNFQGTGLSDTTRHFALQPIPNMQDLEITVTPVSPARPGFFYPIQISCKNVGTTVLSGGIVAVLDSQLIYTGANPPVATQMGNSFSWNFNNLQPQQTKSILLETMVSVTAVLGNSLINSYTANPLAGDLTPTNNTDIDSVFVVGSFDPNDKTVSQDWLTPTEIPEAKPLEYTIRFQNTGTDTAFTVRVIDTLDAQLNIPTFEMLASSHNYTWSIRENGILEWRFDNILLPDSNTNEAASHGFVKYRIRPSTNLALGSIIRNTAAIYFDFNAPVITNTATTEVALFSGVTEERNQQIQVFPNPNKGTFTLQLQGVPEQSVKAELRNVLGQTVWQQNLTAENGNVQQQIKTTSLSKGIYLLRVATKEGIAVQKVVVE